MTKDSDTGQDSKPSRPLKWLQDGLSGAISDSIKAVLIPVVSIIVLGLIGILFFLNSTYINITIKFPAYLVGVGFLLSGIITYTNQRLIRRLFRRLKWRRAHHFLWKTNQKDELHGPCCPICKAFVIELKTGYEHQIKDAFKLMSGATVNHKYKCSNPQCKSKTVSLEFDLQTLIQKVQEEYYSS
ncbi:MAG: hypothetical protein ACOYZ8_11245 [Chloroflexota bacterium]